MPRYAVLCEGRVRGESARSSRAAYPRDGAARPIPRRFHAQRIDSVPPLVKLPTTSHRQHVRRAHPPTHSPSATDLGRTWGRGRSHSRSEVFLLARHRAPRASHQRRTQTPCPRQRDSSHESAECGKRLFFGDACAGMRPSKSVMLRPSWGFVSIGLRQSTQPRARARGLQTSLCRGARGPSSRHLQQASTLPEPLRG